MMDATGEFVDEALAAILPNNYYDLEVVLPKALMPMDEGNKGHLQKLSEQAEQFIRDEQEQIDELLQKLL